jgi:hypothetical protein
LERENVCKKYKFIGELKLGYDRKVRCKNTLLNLILLFLKEQVKKNRASIIKHIQNSKLQEQLSERNYNILCITIILYFVKSYNSACMLYMIL